MKSKRPAAGPRGSVSHEGTKNKAKQPPVAVKGDPKHDIRGRDQSGEPQPEGEQTPPA